MGEFLKVNSRMVKKKDLAAFLTKMEKLFREEYGLMGSLLVNLMKNKFNKKLIIMFGTLNDSFNDYESFLLNQSIHEDIEEFPKIEILENLEKESE